MTTRKYLLKDMTWVEFRDRLAEHPLVLVPLGSQEEQGPHGPMGDFMLTEAIAGRIAERVDAVSAPTLPFGYADYFRPVAGGIQLRPDSFVMVLQDILDSLLDHGLGHVVILNGHSGNYPLIDQVIRRIKRDRGLFVPCVNLWRLITPAKWREFHGEAGAANFGHGADPISSVYLHLFPDLVRPDLITTEAGKGSLIGLPTTGLSGVRFRDVEVNLAVDVTDRCGNGIAGGDPRASTAAIGQAITDYLVALVADFCVHFRSVDPRAAGSSATDWPASAQG